MGLGLHCHVVATAVSQSVSPLCRSLYGLVVSNVGDLQTSVTPNGGGAPIPIPQFLKQTFDYKHDMLGYVVLIMFGFVAIFWLLGAYAFKKFNFQTK